MAIGYQGDPITLPDALKERDLIAKATKTAGSIRIQWEVGNPSPLVLKQ